MTFKDKHIHKFYAFALAAVFALTLAGCGGGGGTAAAPDPEPPTMPEPTPQEMCEGDGGRYNADGSCTSAEDLAAEMTEAEALSAAQEAAMAAYMAAMAAVGGAKDPVAAANAQMYADAAMAASAAAAAATDSAMAMEHQMAAEAASASAVEAGMTRGLGITTLANAASNQSAIDSAKLVGVPAPAPISNAGRVGRAMGAAATAAAGTPATGATGAGMANHQGAVATVSASDTGGGPRFTLAATPAGDSNTANNVSTTLRRGESPSAITTRGGWAGAELVSSGSGPTGYRQSALIFTDINPPAQSYNTGTTADSFNTPPPITDFTTAVDIGGTPSTAVNRSVITGEIPGDGSHFAATFNANPTDNNPARSGRFFCPSATATSTGCSISVDASGVLRSITGYTFQYAVAGSTRRGDSDYLAWGIWTHVPNGVQAPATGGLTNPATVAAFASGSDPFQVQAALTGSATYNGVATGLYSAGGMVEYFEADASLSADFGGRTANDSDPRDDTANDSFLLGAVTGSISNIKAGGMDVDGSLTLGRAPLIAGDATPTINTAATRFTGNTQGALGGRAMQGSWTGQFYGPNRAPAGSVAVRTEFPTTAAGTFGARTPAGAPGVSILGSFGTWKAD